MKRHIATALALAMITSQPAAAQAQEPVAEQTSPEPLTLGEWADLARNERQAMILAAVESLFLAVSDHPQHSEVMDEQCLSGITPRHVEKVMVEVAKERPDLPFVDTFLALTGCYGSAAQ